MEKDKKLNEEIINALIPMAIIMMIEIFFKILNGGLLFLNSSSVIFSLIFGYMIYILILSIVKSTSKTTALFSIIFLLILLINQTKIIYTGEPLYFSDINFINKVGDLTNMLSTNIIYMSIKHLIGIFILVVLFILVGVWNKKHDLKINNNKLRIIMATLSVIIFILLFVPFPHTKEIYLNLLFNINNHQDYNSHTTNFAFYRSNTLLSGMYGVLLNNRFSEPTNYDENELNKILEEITGNNNQKSTEKPNIVIIFSESFWNIDQLEEVEFDKPITANYSKISQEGKLIELLSCAYGGMSENVAFELLTGGKLNYFSNGYIPIMSLYQRNSSEQIPSLVKELKNNNYYTKITFGKDYYNSEKAFKKIGFNEYLEVKQTIENSKGELVSDEYMIDLILNELENKDEEKNIFYMVETIQNHMPYYIEKYEQYDIKINKSRLDEDVNNTLLSYAQGIYDADQQLGKIYTYIQNYEEPTIVLFLGDHLPYLYTEKGENVLDNLEYFNTENEFNNILRKYNTQGLIFSNFELEYNNLPEYLSTDLLLTYIINQTGIELSNYYKWIYETKAELPAYNKYIAIDSHGKMCYTNELQGKIKNVYDIREKMQFKFFIKPTL